MANAELEVINAVCKHKDMGVLLGGSNIDEMFTAYGDVWQAMKQYYNKHRTIPDIKVFQDRFSDIDKVEVSGKTEYYVDQLRETFVQGELKKILVKAAGSLDKNGAQKTHEKMLERLSALSKFTLSARDLNLKDSEAAEKHFEELREMSERMGGVPGISTGFKAIDSAYPTGLSAGHFAVLMGYTGRAKSLFAGLMAVKAWSQGYKPMIISLEMTPEEQRERIYSMMGAGFFQISDLARGDVNIDNFRSWSKKNLHDQSDFIVVSNEGVSDVTPNVVQGKIDTHKPDLVILDYMQLMSDNAKTPSMTPRMMSLSRELKLLATSNNIPIIGITAVTDDDGGNRDTPPVMGQVAWSKAIEYDANLIIAVHKQLDTDLVEVVGRKNRHGDLFNFVLQADINRGIWKEIYDF